MLTMELPDGLVLELCPCCGLPISIHRRQAIDTVIENIEGLDFNRIQLLCSMDEVPYVKTAVECKKRGSGFIFRASMEDWSIEEIVQQLY